MKIYMIPGLGFDHRIFRNLNLPINEPIFLNWIDPLPKENLHDYARRIAEFIPNDKEVMLLGHSFGGILCQKIAQFKKVKMIFLISTIESRQELPTHLKIIAPLHLQNLITRSLILKTFGFWGKSYGYESKEAQSLFKEMIKNNSKSYLKWALTSISTWKESNQSLNCSIVRIHGSLDKTFPLNQMNEIDYTVEGGHHFMVYQKAERISNIIAAELERISKHLTLE